MIPASVLYCCLSKIGSKAGSTPSSTSSTNRGFPFLTHPMVSLKKSLCPNFNLHNELFLFRFLIHLLACCYGSIHKGYLSAYVVRIPFSLDTLSLGRPAIFQFLIVTGSPIIDTKLKSSSVGMSFSRQPSTHFLTKMSL